MLKTPDDMKPVKIQEGISQGVTRSFVLRKASVTIEASAPVQTTCGGLFCDKQNIKEVLRAGRGCGCYSMKDRIGNIVMVHTITVKDERNNIEFEVDFSSMKFDRMFMTNAMPSSMTKRDLDMTQAYFDFVEAIDSLMGAYNENGGFTVVGWYKRGEINDKSSAEDGNVVQNSEVVYHVVQIIPESTEEDASILLAEKFDPRLG